MTGMIELMRIRKAMSDETKEEFVKGMEQMVKIGAYCKMLVEQGIMPQDDFDAYVKFGGLLLLIGEGPEK